MECTRERERKKKTNPAIEKEKKLLSVSLFVFRRCCDPTSSTKQKPSNGQHLMIEKKKKTVWKIE